ncbi:MAG: hypothetical protein R3E90_01150 [Marinicella sp.]
MRQIAEKLFRARFECYLLNKNVSPMVDMLSYWAKGVRTLPEMFVDSQ